MSDIDVAKAAELLYELGQLQQEQRNGWKRIGVVPESVAEHSLRAAHIAFVLAWMEGYPHPHEACALAAFHDIAETRASDLDKVQRAYTDADELRAVREQTAGLGELGDAIARMWRDVDERSTPAGNIAKDADYLDLIVRARELMAQGFSEAQLWIDSIRGELRTESARRLADALEAADPNDWWKRVCGLLPRGEAE